MSHQKILVRIEDVQPGDVIEDLGMTVSDVLAGRGDITLQDRDGAELLMAEGTEIKVCREVEQTDREIIVEALERAKYLAAGGSITAQQEVVSISRQLTEYDLKHL